MCLIYKGLYILWPSVAPESLCTNSAYLPLDELNVRPIVLVVDVHALRCHTHSILTADQRFLHVILKERQEYLRFDLNAVQLH